MRKDTVKEKPIETKMSLNLSRSLKLAEEASDFTPKGVPTGTWWDPHPFYVNGAKGARIFDIDGNEYLDYWCGAGPVILGHAHPEVSQAAIEAIQQGNLQFWLPTAVEVALARKLNEYIPCAEKVAFRTAGTDAISLAVRLARAYTGKSKIAKFEGGYQGWDDNIAVSNVPDPASAGSAARPKTVPDSAGIPSRGRASTIVLPYNNSQAVAARLEKERDRVACVVVEPMMHGNNLMPKPGFLEGLRQVCDSLGIVLVFDEIVTGFRHGLSGGQGVTGVTPDLGCFGKAMGNGYVIAAVCGRKELLSLMVPEGTVRMESTFSGNPLSTSASLKTLEILARPGFYERLFNLGGALREEINRAVQQLGVRVRCDGFGGVWCMYFSDKRPESYRDVMAYKECGGSQKDIAYRQHMLNHHIFILPQSVNRAYISGAHTEEDVQHTVDVTVAFLKEHKAALR